MKLDALSLWIGRTAHVREQPFRRAFHHRVAMIEIDIDRLDDAANSSSFFSVNAFNLVSFHTRDHGSRDGGSLRDWAMQRYDEAGLDLADGSIRLVTFPRVCGYGFAPISIWYGYDAGNTLKGVIYEVHNTFGESHAYVGSIDGTLAPDARCTQYVPKAFHVSPFMDVSGKYRFTLNNPAEKLRLIIENLAGEGRWHSASLLARRRSANAFSILKHFGLRPFAAVGVTAAIHWQAMCLWMRGAVYHSRPTPPNSPSTVTETASQKANRRTLQDEHDRKLFRSPHTDGCVEAGSHKPETCS